MPIIRNEYNERSKGGTELSIVELEKRVPSDVLDKFQIIPSRFRSLEPGLIPIFWVHDTETDPEMQHLADGGWNKFRMLVFVSNWQMQRFIDKFKIPWERCIVLPNAVEPFDKPRPLDWKGTLRFIYHTTPHRGLNVLVAAFNELAKKEDVFLDVYSSFSIYGWEDRDKHFESVFKAIRGHPKMRHHGAVDNAQVRSALRDTHFFAYPCTWPETGCRSLIEAMCAGVVCAHTNFGCLYETAAGMNYTYQYEEDPNRLASKTFSVMRDMVVDSRARSKVYNDIRGVTAARADSLYSWVGRGHQWTNFLRSLL